MLHAKRILLTSVAVLTLASAQAQAQPGDNRGQGQGQGKGQVQREVPGQPGRGAESEPGRGANGANDWHDEERAERRIRADAPRIDEREIRRLLIERRDWIEIDRGAESLPPGVRMNLERGKPLPPGIAMQLDERLLRDLPHYDGYEWRRVGPDVVLVDAANAIIYEILRDIF
ncbi:hypothetical protein HNO53_09210 [Billgrantia antri]|uniref:Nickel/cobalt transporter regulator n=1 Tax=Halomonas sulfidivorans TaxID=2733488 RepID=A0ABX7WEN5_9GAMM|nr:anti-virulence regulator CigR family protein [Halomonas sulfidivorans]QTP58868.1 hypothetical protein HNO53_09210 [Halomonas sulfidivorans]